MWLFSLVPSVNSGKFRIFERASRCNEKRRFHDACSISTLLIFIAVFLYMNDHFELWFGLVFELAYGAPSNSFNNLCIIYICVLYFFISFLCIFYFTVIYLPIYLYVLSLLLLFFVLSIFFRFASYFSYLFHIYLFGSEYYVLYSF